VTMVRFERENFKAKEELLHNEKEATWVFSPKNLHLRRKKNGAGIKYENKEKENNSTHNVLRYI